MLGIKMSVKINYARINRRVIAYAVDQTTFFLVFALFFDIIFSGITLMQDEVLVDLVYIILGELIYVILEVVMIIKLGWTPGKLLCGIYIKDANTLKSITLMRVMIRTTLKVLVWIPWYIFNWFLIFPVWMPSCISIWFSILPILVLIPAIFDQRKQFFHDRITKTVVIDYRYEEHNLDLNYMYVGVIRRIIAYIIDSSIIIGTSFVYYFIIIMFDHSESKLLTIYTCLFFLLSIIFKVLMVIRAGGTPGQLLCYICIKDANTLKNITLMQAIIRYVLEAAGLMLTFTLITFVSNFFDKHISEGWFEPLSDLTFTAIILIIVSAIFDKRKQFFHDKIAKTVAIDYRLSS